MQSDQSILSLLVRFLYIVLWKGHFEQWTDMSLLCLNFLHSFQAEMQEQNAKRPITHLYLVLKNNTGRGWGHGIADSLNPDPTAHLISTCSLFALEY